MTIRQLYRLLSLAGDAKAVKRSPGAYVRRRARAKADGMFARAMRQVLKP